MKIGDQISVIDENLEGKIISIKGDTVTFEDEFGFSYQYSISKIVLKNSALYVIL